jgi:hypothetical protein
MRRRISEGLARVPFMYVLVSLFGLAAVGGLTLVAALLLTVLSFTVLAIHLLEFLLRFL